MTKQTVKVFVWVDGVKTPPRKTNIANLQKHINHIRRLCFLPNMSVVTSLKTNTGKTIILRAESREVIL